MGFALNMQDQQDAWGIESGSHPRLDVSHNLGLRVAVDVPIVGDVRRALTDLLPLLEPQSDRTFFEQIRAKMSEWNQALRRIETSTKLPLQPQQL